MPTDPVLPHNPDDSMQAEMSDTSEEEIDELESLVQEEMVAIIGDFAEDERVSTIRGLQPTEAVIQAMAKAATSVLIAFERGYRMDSH